MATTETFITAEQFLAQPGNGAPAELVRGRVVPMNMPGARHGVICGRLVHAILGHLDEHDAGHLTCNDAGVITQRDPDTVRGADVAFYSYGRLPKGSLPEGYPAVAPDLVFEVRSPGDPWRTLLAKAAEYLEAGVACVCVVEPRRESIVVYWPDRPEETLDSDQVLELPDILPGFFLPLRRLFQ